MVPFRGKRPPYIFPERNIEAHLEYGSILEAARCKFFNGAIYAPTWKSIEPRAYAPTPELWGDLVSGVLSQARDREACNVREAELRE